MREVTAVMVQMIFVKNICKSFVLIFLVLIQVHITLFTVNNIINPITIMYLFYYSPPMSNWEIGWFPYLFIFTFQSVVSYYILRYLFVSFNFRSYLVSFLICVLFIFLFYINESKFDKIEDYIDTKVIAEAYFKYYQYMSAFRLIIGYAILQMVLMITYLFVNQVREGAKGSGSVAPSSNGNFC